MKTASHILKVSLQTGIDNEAKNKSRGKKTSRTAKKAKAKTKESRAKKKINELTRKISEYISTDILDITDEVRKILKGQTTR
jgi:molecular chaperone GrpE (heat shock protein)